MNPFTRYMKDNNEPQPATGTPQASTPQAQQNVSSAPPQTPRSTPISQSPSQTTHRSSMSNSMSKSAPASSSTRPTTGGRNILSSDVEIKGKVNFTNDLVVDGKIEGEISSDGSLTIGENARIKAEIKTRSVVVYGKVYGNITVTDRVELKKDAELVGDIKAATISIEAGAIFVGKSTVGTPSQLPASSSSSGSAKPMGKSLSETPKIPKGADKEFSKASSSATPVPPKGADKEFSKKTSSSSSSSTPMLPKGAEKELSKKPSSSPVLPKGADKQLVKGGKK